MWRGIFTVMRFSATNGVSRWLFSIRMMTLKSRVEMKPSRSWSRSLNACRACSSCMSCHTQYNTPSCFIAFEVTTTHSSTYSSTICYVRIRVGWTLSRSRDVVCLVRNRGVRNRCWSQTRIRNEQSFASVSIRTPLQSNAWRHNKTTSDHRRTLSVMYQMICSHCCLCQRAERRERRLHQAYTRDLRTPGTRWRKSNWNIRNTTRVTRSN